MTKAEQKTARKLVALAAKLGLTEKQRRLIEAYVADPERNGTAAAKAAGYAGNPDTLKVKACQILKSANGQEYLQALESAAPPSPAQAEAVAETAEVVNELALKEAARRTLRKMVAAQIGPLVEAQIKNAMGIRYLVVRNKITGKFLRVTEAMAKVSLGSDEEIVEVWEKDPNVNAFTDLMNRTMDKPPEHIEVDGTLKGGLEITWKSSE
jgi:hypothetical protein